MEKEKTKHRFSTYTLIGLLLLISATAGSAIPPYISDLVPYVGADKNVDLNGQNLSNASYLSLDFPQGTKFEVKEENFISPTFFMPVINSTNSLGNPAMAVYDNVFVFDSGADAGGAQIYLTNTNASSNAQINLQNNNLFLTSSTTGFTQLNAGPVRVVKSIYFSTTTNGNLENGDINASRVFADNPYSGWADYVDTQYNTSSRFTASDGVLTTLPNNAGTIRDSQIPYDINLTGGFYNGTHILGRNGDAYNIAIRGQAEPQAPNVYCQFWYNISGAVGQLPASLVTFPKGSGVSHPLKFSSEEYTLDTWEANGALVEVQCDGGDVEFWDISFVLFRTHKAR